MPVAVACASTSFPTRSIADPSKRYARLQESTFDRSCGPSGCEIGWLASQRLEVDDDPTAFAKLATDAGWGDGLPLIPPTEERVRAFVAASDRFPDELLGILPPRDGRCTVEKLAINAVMAGAPMEAMPLLCAAVEACIDPALDLFSLNTTTSSVAPGLFVNGPVRHELDLPMEAGCFGGVPGPAPAIRALTATPASLTSTSTTGGRTGAAAAKMPPDPAGSRSPSWRTCSIGSGLKLVEGMSPSQ